MTLDDQVVGESPAIKVSIRTFVDYDADYRKLVWLDSPGDFLKYTEMNFGGEETEAFVSKLKRGDKILILEYEGKVKLVYGPIDEEKLCIRQIHR